MSPLATIVGLGGAAFGSGMLDGLFGGGQGAEGGPPAAAPPAGSPAALFEQWQRAADPTEKARLKE